MKSWWEWTRMARILALVATAGSLIIADHAAADERKFVVMLAHSPKSFVTGGNPGLPPGGLFSVEAIRKDYFDRIDPNIDSFAEYWEEISYGDVAVTGETFGWVTLPWAFDPNPPNAPARASPANYVNLRSGRMFSEGVASLPPFAYGAGEDFCDAFSSFDNDAETVTTDKCGALIIIDLVAETEGAAPPLRGPGMVDSDVVGINVWTPGERFLDLDGDGRWDGLDEKNDMMCHGSDGCTDTLCSESDKPCNQDGDCARRETCGTDLFHGRSGPRGCNTPGCGDRAMPCLDWDGDGTCANPSSGPAGCPIPVDDNNPLGICLDTNCVPTNCVPDREDVSLPECCEQEEPLDRADCVAAGGIDIVADPGAEGILCGDPIFCCEFDDGDGDDEIDVIEPFEDFIVRWNPAGASPGTVWVRVDEDYIRNNYPGDVEELVIRTGNGYYDSPDLFVDTLDADENPVSTKMMQDAGVNRFAWRTPKPGARYSSGPPNFEEPWFDSFWSDRYGSTAPPWPGGSGAAPPFNSPIMRPFDPAEPVPPIARGTPGRRWFLPNRGGSNGRGVGSAEDPTRVFVVGGDWPNEPAEVILPEEAFGYYDGWVEHDDLASSKYHSEGDKRLGEVTAPRFDIVAVPGTGDGTGANAEYTAIFGVDLGRNNPLVVPIRDNFCVAAGPGAVNIHGEKGFDAGDVCILEWLTWRTDGTSMTRGSRWALDNGDYHPFANRVGFRDYNLDGMIDQGEVRPELSENYSVDSDPWTNPNDGYTGNTNYPFNRLRLIEDVVEALDPSADWDDVMVGNRVSGIVLVPSDSYSDDGLFPLAPSYYPIHTQDLSGVQFHDLVTCQDCFDAPSAIRYASHEYLHTWEGYPDLYDYNVFEQPLGDVVQCPIGAWDIMSRVSALVHPNPVLKARSGWVDTVDLESVLTPGVEKTLTLPPAEFVRDESYFFLENSEGPGERYYLWSAGSGFDERFPGRGMLILRTTDFAANVEALALQQHTPPFNFVIVQADGQEDLEACSSTGNIGDAGDPWPGTAGTTRFDLNTDPPATWQDTRWTGLTVSDIEPDGNGSVLLTLSWVPTNLPSLRFTNPPGGESHGSMYTVWVEATDVHGGTTIEVYYTADDSGAARPAAADLIQRKQKGNRGTNPMSFDWDITGVPDDQYVLFAKLIPGRGPDGGLEPSSTIPRAGRNNSGNGTLNVTAVDVTSNNSTARLETWTVVCIDPQDGEWRVNASLTQPEPAANDPNQDPFPHAITGAAYTSLDGEVTFTITQGSEPFALEDSFSFITTGITAVSKAVTIADGKISEGPTARIHASPLAGDPPLMVTFNGDDSDDPNGEPLEYRWRFGDESLPASGNRVEHLFDRAGKFTVTLKVTNPSNDLIGETSVDILVTNNSPRAVISAAPTSGQAPLEVQFSAEGSSDTETIDREGLIYFWDFGDGQTANTERDRGTRFASVTHTYRTKTDGTLCSADNVCIFTATLTVTDECEECEKEDTDTIQIVVGNTDPVAVVAVSPLQGPAPLEVRFNAINSRDADDDILKVDWSFGDGQSRIRVPIAGNDGTGVVQHTYTQPGDYQPTALIRDYKQDGTTQKGGLASWFGVTIRVTENKLPSADFVARPATGFVGDPFTFDAGRSSDQDGSIVAYRWDFGDDEIETGTIPTIIHTYALPNLEGYEVVLTVTDDSGGTDEFRHTVIVQPVPGNRPPNAFITTGPRTGTAPVTLTFDGRNSYDPDEEDDVLTFTWEIRQGVCSGDGKACREDAQCPSGETCGDRRVCEGNGEACDTDADCPTGEPCGNKTVLFGDLVQWEFKSAGIFKIALKVNDARGGVGSAGPVDAIISAAGEPPPGQDVPDDADDDNNGGNSADQRPSLRLCGLGMLMGLFASLLGLTAMRVVRHRGRR